MITLWRMITFGVQHFWRNIWLSLVTVLIVMLNLFMISLVVGINVVGQQTLTAVKERVNLSVYFTTTTSEQKVEEISQEVKKKPEVTTAVVVSRAEHLDQLRQAQGQSDLINKAIDVLGENPLGPGLVVTAKTLDGYNAITDFFEQAKYASIIEDVGNNFKTNQALIDRLTVIVNRVQHATWWLTLFFASIAMLMVFNTLRVNIYAHREEIGIMKLVGASDSFVRGPFIVSSLMYGFFAAILAMLILLPVLAIINPSLTNFFGEYNIDIFQYVRDRILIMAGLELALGCALSGISSLFAVGKYLRV